MLCRKVNVVRTPERHIVVVSDLACKWGGRVVHTSVFALDTALSGGIASYGDNGLGRTVEAHERVKSVLLGRRNNTLVTRKVSGHSAPSRGPQANILRAYSLILCLGPGCKHDICLIASIDSVAHSLQPFAIRALSSTQIHSCVCVMFHV